MKKEIALGIGMMILGEARAVIAGKSRAKARRKRDSKRSTRALMINQQMIGGARIQDILVDSEKTLLALDNGFVIDISGAWYCSRS